MKVAFIGAGYMAREHIRVFSDIPDVQLAGIMSRSIPKAISLAAEYGIPHVCASISELHAKSHADLLVIAVPELSVSKVCLEAFEFPWITLVEKPAGYDLKDANLILNASHRSDARVYVGLNRRHYSSTNAILRSLNTVEDQRLIRILDQENQNAALLSGQPEKVVENWMYANSIHLIDYFSILGRGKIVSVDPIISWNPKKPWFVASKIRFSSGDIGLYEAVWNGPGPWSVSVTTKQINWELRPLEEASFQKSESRAVHHVEVDEWDLKFKPGLRAQAEEAIKMFSGQAHALPSLDDAMNSMKLVQQIYEK